MTRESRGAAGDKDVKLQSYREGDLKDAAVLSEPEGTATVDPSAAREPGRSEGMAGPPRRRRRARPQGLPGGQVVQAELGASIALATSDSSPDKGRMSEGAMTEALELSEAVANLDRLIGDLGGKSADWNEADTRFQIIDRLLIECLGWPRGDMRLEKPDGREFADYELGAPCVAIWEAKREGKVFELPVRKTAGITSNIQSLRALGGPTLEAIDQVNNYCLRRGVDVAVATNGHQLVAFMAAPVDLDGAIPGKCLVLSSLAALKSNLSRVWQLLSPGAFEGAALRNFLMRSDAPRLPPKLSARIPNFPQYRSPSDLQRSLKNLAELLMIDVADQPDIEKQFYEECYSESGALSQHALIGKQMLRARYAALFDESEAAPALTPVVGKGGRPQLTPEVLAEAVSNRPIVLVGDVGVGKSSFLKRLMYVSAFSEFQDAVFTYVDLGRRGALQADLSEVVLSQIEETLIKNYNVDIYEDAFVRGVYNLDIKRFERGIYGRLRETDPAAYENRLLEDLSSRQSNRSEHFKKSIEHISLARKKQIIIAIDNADQRDYKTQQDAFIIAQTLSAEWRATVFVSVRPRTFYYSRRSGALSAYPHRMFTVSPPRIDDVISKRLKFALEIAQGRRQIERLRSVSLNLGHIASMIRVLLRSIADHDDVAVFLGNITGGNIREVVEFIARLIGSPNIDTETLVRTLEAGDSYDLPIHEFWKVAMREDFWYFEPESSMALNIFDIDAAEPAQHFLLPILLAYLDQDGGHKSPEGFVDTKKIFGELQSRGFRKQSIEWHLMRANNKKLIEAPGRVTFEEDELGLFGGMPESFRLNTKGAYHLKVWMPTFTYLEAISIDTPILDEVSADSISADLRSFALSDRFDRATAFVAYLKAAWSESDLQTPYFDFELALEGGVESFDRVRRATVRNRLSRSG